MTLPMPGAPVAEWVKTMGCPLPAALASPVLATQAVRGAYRLGDKNDVVLRRGRDLNPREGYITLHSLSRRAPSTTRPPLQTVISRVRCRISSGSLAGPPGNDATESKYHHKRCPTTGCRPQWDWVRTTIVEQSPVAVGASLVEPHRPIAGAARTARR